MERILLGLLFLSECVILSTCFPYQYHFADQSLTWTEAQTYCRQKHTDLVSIRNSEELNQLINMLSSAGHSSEVWIGLFKEFDWKWSDGFNGTGAEYRNWETNQPGSISELYVLIGGFGRWWDNVETNVYPCVCYTGTQLNPRYVLVNQYMTWPNAQRFCRENFTDLATVRNDAENQAVTSVAQKAAWIGLFRGPNFYWSDESSFLFTNWQSGENQISSTTDMCGVTSLQNSGQWKFSSCETKLPFVCYKPAVVWRQVVKLRLKMEDSLTLNDPVLRANIMKMLQDRLKENRVSGVTLKWRGQPVEEETQTLG
ncbi:secretory phospholipase A2 receptor-like [Kryptolebias marmoratus]|uniref:secretory phospholipase A2 receptor-like n=1 Tax=Kryptolebias marmoratus TaxID=37003 RepID=UPI000D530D99|nr:secretory phospholipase A2 receptor-like [Kryptolebias marmoratus]